MVTWHPEPDEIKWGAHKTRHEDGGADEITLEAGDIIEGDAAAATVVDYVISGVENAWR